MLSFGVRRNLAWSCAFALLFSPDVVLALFQEGERAVATHAEGAAEGKLSAAPVQLKVVVSEFIPLAGSDSFFDGSGIVYSHTLLSVVEPVTHFGRHLTIEHVVLPQEGSLWNAVGTELVIELPVYVLQVRDLIIPVGSVRLIEQ